MNFDDNYPFFLSLFHCMIRTSGYRDYQGFEAVVNIKQSWIYYSYSQILLASFICSSMFRAVSIQPSSVDIGESPSFEYRFANLGMGVTSSAVLKGVYLLYCTVLYTVLYADNEEAQGRDEGNRDGNERVPWLPEGFAGTAWVHNMSTFMMTWEFRTCKEFLMHLYASPQALLLSVPGS